MLLDAGQVGGAHILGLASRHEERVALIPGQVAGNLPPCQPIDRARNAVEVDSPGQPACRPPDQIHQHKRPQRRVGHLPCQHRVRLRLFSHASDVKLAERPDHAHVVAPPGAVVGGVGGRGDVEHKQPVDARRVQQSKRHGNLAPQRVAAQDGASDAELVQQPKHIGGHLLKRHGRRVVRVAVVAQINEQHPPRLALGRAVLAQSRGPALEVASRAEQPVHDHNRWQRRVEAAADIRVAQRAGVGRG
mmetsp:Transcript_22669/g.73346  ORF Transcript_22669/g.73346 Transcript_22669/m.73346 type:complete len:247 (-) Transcript_22669:97-837(-)